MIDFDAMLRQALSEAEKGQEVAETLFSVGKEYNIEDYKVLGVDECVYVSEFVTEAESDVILQKLGKDWIDLENRRFQNHGGVPHPNGTILEPLSPMFTQLGHKIVQSKLLEEAELPDQSLVNEYSTSGSLGFHKDGPNFKPKAAILSLNRPCFLAFRLPDSGKTFKLYLEPRSLLIFSGELYTLWEHAVFMEDLSDPSTALNSHLLSPEKEVTDSKSKRVSLTLRQVSKVSYRMQSVDEVLPQETQLERSRRLNWWLAAVTEIPK